ncbi:MAG: hypothetical protein HY456_03050 [Parcubacteria group bacterium]|nr:hypothetical protein [Parcubacteria group bacterium]
MTIENLREKIDKWGVFWGVIYGLVALGFYFTPFMVILLGLASVSTAAALQAVLFKGFRWHFALLGALLTFETILLYLRRSGVNKLTISEITLHRAYIGTLIMAFVATYVILFLLVALVLRT